MGKSRLITITIAVVASAVVVSQLMKSAKANPQGIGAKLFA